MNKFAAGPWKVVADERYDRFAEADRIVGYDIKSEDGEIVGSEGISGDSEINLANARLIAAAPDLLEAAQLALQIAESWIHDQLDGTSSIDGALLHLDPVRAAIARARGEA